MTTMSGPLTLTTYILIKRNRDSVYKINIIKTSPINFINFLRLDVKIFYCSGILNTTIFTFLSMIFINEETSRTVCLRCETVD